MCISDERKKIIFDLLIYLFLINIFDYKLCFRYYGKYWVYNRWLFSIWDYF